MTICAFDRWFPIDCFVCITLDLVVGLWLSRPHATRHCMTNRITFTTPYPSYVYYSIWSTVSLLIQMSVLPIEFWNSTCLLTRCIWILTHFRWIEGISINMAGRSVIIRNMVAKTDFFFFGNHIKKTIERCGLADVLSLRCANPLPVNTLDNRILTHSKTASSW